MVATARPGIFHSATKSTLEGGIQGEDDKQEDENKYPHGFSLVLLTIGLMAVVLILGLDNYIISLFK